MSVTMMNLIDFLAHNFFKKYLSICLFEAGAKYNAILASVDRNSSPFFYQKPKWQNSEVQLFFLQYKKKIIFLMKQAKHSFKDFFKSHSSISTCLYVLLLVSLPVNSNFISTWPMITINKRQQSGRGRHETASNLRYQTFVYCFNYLMLPNSPKV